MNHDLGTGGNPVDEGVIMTLGLKIGGKFDGWW